MSTHPYAERFPVNRALPATGRPRAEVLAELRTMAAEEDADWETGKCSGTMYCGDHDHYAFMNDAFGLYAHMNALQRDMCPSSTRFEGEIIAMGLDLFHADAAAAAGTEPAGLATTGGTGSILHAVLAYREHATSTLGIVAPNLVKPETAHPAFDKACHLFGLEVRTAPVDPVTTEVDVAAVADRIDAQTIALIGSACNYGYGTVDPIGELSELALSRGVGLHVDGCLGGFILPFGQELGYPIEPFDFRVPGVTSISADTHKYGYSFKGTSFLGFRDKALRNSQYFFLPGWSGGKYCSPGIEGSRSAGLLAATWASMVHLGREGYRRYAGEIFATSAAMQAAVRSHPALRILGSPTFLFSFTSDDYDIYLVNDFLRTRGWRLNGQQYPNALHMAVTRPQTQPGVAEAFAADLADAVADAERRHAAGEVAQTGAVYGGVVGGLTDEADAFIRAVMSDLLDGMQSVPEPAMRVVRAGAGDADLVLEAGELFDDRPRAEWVATFLAAPGHHLLLALTDDGEPVGFVTGVEMTHPDKGTELFVYELGTDAAHRRRGVATVLLAALAELATERGCYGLWVATEPDNGPALATYRAAGYTAEPAVVLARRLGPP